MTDAWISREELSGLLERSTQPLAPSLRGLVKMEDKARYRLGRQPADRTWRTFALKYGMVQERGLTIDGLTSLLDRLAVMGHIDIAACVLQGEGAFGVVVLEADLSGVVGVLYGELSREADSDE